MAEVIAEIPKGKAVIRISRQTYKRREVIDVRLWYRPKGQTELVPSRKGFTFDASMLPLLREGLKAA